MHYILLSLLYKYQHVLIKEIQETNSLQLLEGIPTTAKSDHDLTSFAIPVTVDFSLSTDYNCSTIALRQTGGRNSFSVNGFNFIGKNGNKQATIDSSLLYIIQLSILNDGSIEDATNYSQKAHLFEKFRRDSTLKNSDSTFIAWYDSAGQGNIGKFNQIKQLMFLATDTSQIHNDSTLIAFYLNEATTTNQSITTTLVVETNKKAINDVYIKKLVKRNYDLSANEKTLVDTIAAKCPYSDGVAVIEARAIQRHWNDTMHYDNDALCEISLPKQARKSENITNDIFVYPNPTENMLILRSNIAGKLLISDATGRSVLEQAIETPLTNINVKQLEPGIYLLTVYCSNKVVNTVQVIKIE